jgi:hypothetical protein
MINQHYSPEFKDASVRKVIARGYPAPADAQQYGLRSAQ